MARPKSSVPLASPDEIEQQFYEALQSADLERLMEVWADEDEISCVHPGGQRLVGVAAIRGAFADFAGRFRVAKCVAVCLRTRSEITITVAKNVTVIVNRGSQSMLQCASFQFTPCIKPIFGLQQSSCRRSGIARPPQAIDQP